MQLDQIFQGSSLPVILGVCCCGLCVVGLALTVLAPVFNLIGGLLDIVLQIGAGLFELGPVPGCGCVLALVALGLVAGLVLLVSGAAASCGTASATNFCTLLGR